MENINKLYVVFIIYLFIYLLSGSFPNGIKE